MKTQKEILTFLSDNRNYFKENFNIIRIGLFGSYSRGDQTINSDIDLVVEFEENTPELYEKKNSLKQYIKDKLGLNADICREKYIKPRIKKSILGETQYAY